MNIKYQNARIQQLMTACKGEELKSVKQQKEFQGLILSFNSIAYAAESISTMRHFKILPIIMHNKIGSVTLSGKNLDIELEFKTDEEEKEIEIYIIKIYNYGTEKESNRNNSKTCAPRVYSKTGT